MKSNNSIAKTLVFLAALFFFSACKTLPWPDIAEPMERLQPEPDGKVIRVNSEKKVPPYSKKEQKTFVHKVRWEGETLTYISSWYTGSPRNWRDIAAANPDLDPNRILIGDKIVIPNKLVKNRKSMPRSYIPQFRKEEKAQKAPRKRIASPKPQPALTTSPKPVPAESSIPAKSSNPAPAPPTPPETESEEIELFGPVGLD